MTHSSSFPSIAMAAPVSPNSRPLVCHLGLPPAADELVRRVLAMVAEFVGPCGIDGANQHHVHHFHPHHLHHESGTNLRTPKLSLLGFASLLLGISSTLMLFGSFAFFLGFMLMPLIVPVCVVVCVGALLATFKEGRRPTSSSSAVLQGRSSLQRKGC